MKNKEMVYLCYKFFNRFITASELVQSLNDIDYKDEGFDVFKKDLKTLVESIPNVEDDFVKNKKKSIKELLDKLRNVPNTKEFEQLNKYVNSLKSDYEKDYDCENRWFKATEFIDDNDYFNECFDSMSDYEMLEFIAQYICAPFPPQINEDEFIKLIRVGIKHDEREWLWRMALNYEHSGFDFSLISDYFIKVKDAYYLVELLCAVKDSLNIDGILDKLKDKKFIEEVKSKRDILENCLTKKQLNKLMEM